MSAKSTPGRESRRDRLAAALRENLRRRKAQDRTRAQSGPPDGEEGTKPAPDGPEMAASPSHTSD
ncbi:MAG: hypothetical protein GC166_10895 [Alphaproteobacteria bacterium]|nr:hypothetical protein [Alphaproteobacteria bacterium]